MVRKTFTYNGKRYTVRGTDEKDAIMKLALRRRELEEEVQIVSPSMTVEEWGMECIELYKTSQAESTHTKYINRMKHNIFLYIGNKRLKDVTHIDVQETLNKQIGLSKYSIDQTYQMLRFIFSKAKINHLIKEDPTEALVKPGGYKNERRQMTPMEEEVFLKVTQDNPRYLPFFIMYHTGVRPSELRELKTTDLVKIDGYDLLHIRGTKTKNADRHVPIPPSLAEKIQFLPKRYVLTNANGKRCDDKAFRRAWNALKRDMNLAMGCKTYRNKLIDPPLAEDFVPYILRHTYCCHLLFDKKLDLKTVQILMGHSDIRLTANIYAHSSMDVVLQAAKLCNFYS